MPKKQFVVANPKAGLKRIRRFIPSLKKLFESSGFAVEIYEIKEKATQRRKYLKNPLYMILLFAPEATEH